MSYDKKNEDESSLLKVDRTSVFQEGAYNKTQDDHHYMALTPL
jgi:hypothetical protein